MYMSLSDEGSIHQRRSRLGRLVKHAVDRLLALIGLVLLAPVLLAFWAAIRLLDGKPVWFRQERIGKEEKPFTLLKFRTMVVDAEELRPGPHRITRMGNVLRRSGLDELPQLVNVLRGEMSLVGPRPLLPRYLPFFTARERFRHEVRPGLTGWAQLQGRNTLDWDTRLALDVWYVENGTFGLDMRLIARTVFALLRGGESALDPDLELPPLDVVRKPPGSG